jgi:hypothetical protein
MQCKKSFSIACIRFKAFVNHTKLIGVGKGVDNTNFTNNMSTVKEGQIP